MPFMGYSLEIHGIFTKMFFIVKLANEPNQTEELRTWFLSSSLPEEQIFSSTAS